MPSSASETQRPSGVKLTRNQWVLFCNPVFSGHPEGVRPEEMGPMLGPFQRVWILRSQIFVQGSSGSPLIRIAGFENDTDQWSLAVHQQRDGGWEEMTGLNLPERRLYTDVLVLAQHPEHPIDGEGPEWRQVAILDLPH